MKDYKQGLEKPRIQGLNADNEIDLDQLGSSHLVTYARYPGMMPDDVVSPTWLGANAAGDAFDCDGATYLVEDADPEVGLKIEILNSVVRGAEGGEAFYSYKVNGTMSSLRTFCFVGVRPKPPSEGLSAILAVQSHSLTIKPDELESVGVMFIVMPYQAMQPRDVITFTFQGFDEHGTPEQPEIEKLTVTKEHLDNKPLMFTVGKNILRFIDPGTAQVSYSVTFADGKSLDSPVQNFVVDSGATLPTPLAAPRIAGHTPGEPLDPGKFRDGLAVHIDGYPGMSISDHVTLYWRSPVRDVFASVRVDASTHTVGAIVLHLPVDLVLENQASDVSLSYLFSREGASLQSQSLTVAIDTTRVLSVPLIKSAAPDEEQDHGTMPASKGYGGVRVEVPDVRLPGERVEVHWRGWPELGEFVGELPEGDNSLVVPEEYVPANMGRGLRDQSRRFEVAYRVIGNGTSLDSAPYHLRITPLDSAVYPQIQCEGVIGKRLSRSQVPPGGAQLTLDTWAFGRAGQLLNIWVTGPGPDGEPSEDIRTASTPVTVDEAGAGVSAKLSKEFLYKLTEGDDFTLHVTLSFDGGAFYRKFPTMSITLDP
ncbi:hypothetical protein GVN15_20940 [Pseudomonas putida]|uniref:hypothetical protein n=1 Tax=Pseudomonas TaxID=286 RepID=UPI001378DACC|nr:hypothetical protein [Pseudomonas putida]NBA83108.1 hypothetical protein [Pseudomonas putida]